MVPGQEEAHWGVWLPALHAALASQAWEARVGDTEKIRNFRMIVNDDAREEEAGEGGSLFSSSGGGRHALCAEVVV